MKPNWLSVGKSFQESEVKAENQIIALLPKEENTFLKKRKSVQESDIQTNNSSSDNDDSDDDNELLRSINPYEKINYLPNGRVLITSDNKYDTSKYISSWYLDTRKDPNILCYEGYTTNDADIPKYRSNPYSIVNVNDTMRTKYNAKFQQIVSTESNSSIHQTTTKARTSNSTTANEKNEKVKSHRYFSKRYKRFLLDPTYSKVHFHSTAKMMKNIKSEDILKHTDNMIIFPYIDTVLINELFSDQQVLTDDNTINNDDNNTIQTTTSVTSNTKLASILLNKINKYINIKLRTNDDEYISLIHCVSIQDVLHELTCRSSGQVTDIFQNIYLKHSKDVRLNMKLILERKLDLLENILKQCIDNSIVNNSAKDHHRVPHHISLIIYPILCNLYQQLCHPEKIKNCIENAIKENQLDFNMHMIKYQHHLTQFNELNFTDLLQNKLNNIRIDLQRTCKNLQAATELLTLTTTKVSLGKLQKEQMNRNLDIELQYLNIDVYLLQLLQIQCFGRKELSIGLIQALLAFHFSPTFPAPTTGFSASPIKDNSSNSLMTIEDFCTSYWESEAPRYGELHQIAMLSLGNSTSTIEQLKSKLYRNSDMDYILTTVEKNICNGRLLQNSKSTQSLIDEVDVNINTNQHQLLQSLEAMHSNNTLAAAYFLEQLEQSQQQEVASSSIMRYNTAQYVEGTCDVNQQQGGHPPSPHANEDDSSMVYSVLHGYKININTNHDSGQIYKKILNNISENTVEKTYLAPTTDINIYPHVDLNNLLTSTNVYEMKWKHDQISSLFQWRPLRALLDDTGEISAVEQQPERVLFADDLKPFLFKLTRVDKSSPLTLLSKADLVINQRLWIRSMQALGVSFPYSECSHSLLNRLASKYYHSDEIPSKLDQDFFDAMLTLHNPGLVHKDHIDIFKLLKEKSNERFCLLSSTLLRKHILSKKFNMDSEFDFVIHLVEDALMKHNCARFSEDFLNELRCLLIYLITVKYRIELNYTSESGQLILFQQVCRGIIEQSVPTATSDVVKPVQKTCPMVGNLNIWCQYIESEISLGNYADALKFADRILKSVDIEYSNQEKILFNGYTRLIFLSIKLLVIFIPKYDNTSAADNTNNRSKHCMHIAIHLAIYFGYSGYLQVMDTQGNITSGECCKDSKGRYSNQLKEAIPTKSIKKKSINQIFTTMNITNEDIINVIEIYQLKAMALMQQLSDAVVIARKVRATTSEHGCVQIDSISACEKIDATPQDLYYILNISAWLQVLSTLYNSTFDIDKYESYYNTEINFKNVITFGNNVYKASTEVIKSILLPIIPSNKKKDHPTSSLHSNDMNAITDEHKKHHKTSRTLFLQSSLLEYNVNCSSFQWKNGFVEKEYLQNMKFSSPVESSMIVLLEKLYLSQINMLVSISDLQFHSSNNNSETNAVNTAKIDYSYIHKCIHQVIHIGIRDFPLNTSILSSFVLLHSMSHQGYLYIRAYFRELKKYRQYWDGNLQSLECIYAIYNEFIWFTKFSKRINHKISNDTNLCNIFTSTFCHVDNWIVYKDCMDWSNESTQRFIDVLENYLLDHSLNSIVFIWKSYIEILVMKLNFDDAKKVYFRAIHSCGWCKSLYMYAFGPLKCVFSDQEVELIQQILQEKGFYLRVCQ